MFRKTWKSDYMRLELLVTCGRLNNEASADVMRNTIHTLLWQRRCTTTPAARGSCRLGAIIDHGAQWQSAILPIFVVPVMSTLAHELVKARES